MSKNIPQHKIEERHLDSGAKLLHVDIPNSYISMASAWFLAGSRFDPEGKEGLAHFFEHLFLRNTTSYPDRKTRYRDIEFKGLDINGVTNPEAAYYYSEQRPEQVYDGIDFVLDSTQNSIIQDRDVKDEHEVVLDELHEWDITPQAEFDKLFREAMWPDSKLSRPILGTKKSLESITLKDVQEYQQKHYASPNTTYVMISHEPTDKLAEYLNKNERTIEGSFDFRPEKFSPPQKLAFKENNDLDRVKVSIDYRGPAGSNTEDFTVMELAKNILSAGCTGKLNEVLRLEHNLTYWVYGDSENYKDTGSIGFYFSVNPKYVNRALDLALEEIKKFVENGVQKKELAQYKNAFLANLIRTHAEPAKFLTWYGYQVIDEVEKYDLADYIQKIEQITPKKLQSVAKKYLDDKNRGITVFGPIKEKDILAV